VASIGPETWQRAEGLAILAAASVIFSASGWSWWWFAALLLVPDISMSGYVKSPQLGAFTYNLAHSLVLPLVLGTFAFATSQMALFALCAIWLAHIGMDRALGYGLKYGDSFIHTHLGYIGKPKKLTPPR